MQKKSFTMRAAVKALFILPLITFSYSAGSQDAPLYNIKDFELLGVSLDHNAEEVIQGLTEYFSITPDELKIQTNFSGSEIEYVNIRTENIRVSTFLEGKIENENVLDLLTARVTEKNFDAFIKKAIDQYGQPSIIASEPVRYFWCEKLNEAKDDCELFSGRLTIRYKESKGEMSASLWTSYEL